MCHRLLLLTVIAVMPASTADPLSAQEKGKEPKRSEFFRNFDPGRILAKHAEILKKTGKPWGSGSRRNLMVSYPPMIKAPGESMSDFHLEGEISDKELKEMLASLKSEFLELARGKVAIVGEPSDRIGARPIIWFSVIFGPNWLDLAHIRGYYFTYRQGKIGGTVEILAGRTDPRNAKQWKIACAVHEREE
jgi:hypothetical protein